MHADNITRPVPHHSNVLQDRRPSSYLTNSVTVTLKIIYKQSHNNCKKCEQCFFNCTRCRKRFQDFWSAKLRSAFYPHVHTYGPQIFVCVLQADDPQVHTSAFYKCPDIFNGFKLISGILQIYTQQILGMYQICTHNSHNFLLSSV